ncbi:hypothetical protein CEQ90_19090 [Lewinellaceae bacterium SD302]|nr:hypothetical protein CEQ90_19090 [Lewinellaceae bacterium SD302]
MSRLFYLLSLLFVIGGLSAQVSDDAVLFSVADREVTVGEFKYIYGKTNGDNADYSRESLQEYLDLYERFKLKVNRAYDMGLDTVKSLQQELAGYRRQLADNYLIDRAVTDRLVEELYQRAGQDVDISHILIAVKPNASPEDSLKAYQQIMAIAKETTAKNFATVAGERSQDTYSKDKGGRIGYLNAPFPNGLYALESAVYKAKPGAVVGPVRTKFGYHLALVNDKRPARGEVEVAHVMTRKPEKGDATKAQEKIERAYALLESGQPFEQVASSTSEDEKTARNGGYIGFFGINKTEKTFEDAAFALEEDDDYSGIIESRVGYHIIRRISKKEQGTLEEERAPLTAKVKEDGRFKTATEALLTNIRKRANFSEDKAAFGAYTATLADSTFFTFKWKPQENRSRNPVLFRMGDDQTVTVADFEEYLQKNARKRVSARRRGNSAQVARNLYEEFQEEQLMAYAESQLEKDYPEFRALMREYEEGILLFEATKMEVWDKAGQDSVGLEAFFAKNRESYRWKDRARVSLYTIYPKIAAKAGAIRKLAAKSDPEAVLEAFQIKDATENRGVTVQTDSYERDRLPKLAEVDWKAGAMTELERNNQNGRFTFYKIEEVLGSAPKELDEARGYVIADYQDQLEREWVAALRKEYPVKIRKRVFEKLVKKQ